MIEPSGKKYKLTKDLTYNDVIVPVGYETDGISYKFRLVGIFINKFDPRYIEAVIVHDYLTDLGYWERANRYFEEMLPNTLTARSMVIGVKMYRKLIGK